LTTHQGGAAVDSPEAGPPRPRSSGIWNRQLAHYPDNGPRTLYLGITVLATVILYYELYVQSAVATTIISDYHMSFTFFVFVLGRERGRCVRVAARGAR